MTIEEENYWRGYIDAKVEGMGKVKAYYVSEDAKMAYRDKLLEEKGISGDTNLGRFDWQLHAMLIMTGIALGVIIGSFVFGGALECWKS